VVEEVDQVEQLQVVQADQVGVEKEKELLFLDHQEQITLEVVAEEDLILHLKQVEMADQES
jgi:hypothetical protein